MQLESYNSKLAGIISWCEKPMKTYLPVVHNSALKVKQYSE